MVKCLTGAKFTMDAEVLSWTAYTGTETPTSEDTLPAGNWTTYQDPITLEIRNEWRPTVVVADNPLTTTVVETKPVTIRCLARGVVSSGIQSGGNTEDFGNWYKNIEIVQMWVPANYNITKRDRITNIRERKGGKIVWTDDEYNGVGGVRPTVFNVTGVTPLFDPFNRHTQNLLFLEKTD